MDFDAFADRLLIEGVQQSPSYIHGGICGVYASAGALPAEECLAAAGQALGLALQGELAEISLDLARQTLAALADEAFAFQLYLPDDEVEIEQRVQALAEWCRGFMAGFALMVSGSGSAGLDSGSSESLSDIAAIAEAAFDAEADEEESESSFYELGEYLRFATLDLFMGRLDERGEPGPESDGGGASA